MKNQEKNTLQPRNYILQATLYNYALTINFFFYSQKREVTAE